MPRLSTAAALRARPGARTKIIPDASIPGLQLRIRPNGTRTFLLRYWLLGKERVIGLGSMPETQLADARDLAEKYRRALRDRIDPLLLREGERDAQERAE